LLEDERNNVRDTFTPASPNDPCAYVNTTLFHLRAGDAPWLPVLFGLKAFSCENYPGLAGLAEDVF
jgi:hypothetical protein